MEGIIEMSTEDGKRIVKLQSIDSSIIDKYKISIDYKSTEGK